MGGGARIKVDSILASHPATLSLIINAPKTFFHKDVADIDQLRSSKLWTEA